MRLPRSAGVPRRPSGTLRPASLAARSSARLVMASAFSAATTSLAPAAASASAVPRPIPWPAALTRATRPASTFPLSATRPTLYRCPVRAGQRGCPGRRPNPGPGPGPGTTPERPYLGLLDAFACDRTVSPFLWTLAERGTWPARELAVRGIAPLRPGTGRLSGPPTGVLSRAGAGTSDTVAVTVGRSEAGPLSGCLRTSHSGGAETARNITRPSTKLSQTKNVISASLMCAWTPAPRTVTSATLASGKFDRRSQLLRSAGTNVSVGALPQTTNSNHLITICTARRPLAGPPGEHLPGVSR